ncbi:MAG: hypothetical protein AB7F19_01870 [Candidatus Babeliales bacterium]
MKKSLFILALVSTASAFATEDINFDIANYTTEPLYFEVGTEANPPKGWDLKLLNASKKQGIGTLGRLFNFVRYSITKAPSTEDKGTFYQGHVNNQSKVLILLSRTPNIKEGSSVTMLTINPQKHIIIRVKEDPTGIALFANDKRTYIAGPQTGPLQGKLGYNDRILPLEKNVQTSDIQINTNYVIKDKDLSPKEKDLLRHKEFKGVTGEQITVEPF